MIAPGTRVEQVELPVRGVLLAGDLVVPAGALGLVAFAHGSGSSRHSARNRLVAGHLVARGLATLLFDLLTPAEEAQDELDAALRFDIPLLAGRLVGAVDWTAEQEATRGLRVGTFGASTGAAAALIAAAERPERVGAVVSRGGRADLAGDALERVHAPALLLVGELDEVVLELNRSAARRLPRSELVVVPGASHLFPEPGALEAVARHAGAWFEQHLGPGT